MMRIGEASERCGLPVRTIRYYEDVGLVQPKRSPNGYRDYDGGTLQRLVFLRRARGLGFSLNDCRALLSLYEDEGRASADVKRLTLSHLDAIDRKLAELQSLRDTLSDLADACRGDGRPECPILQDLARETP